MPAEYRRQIDDEMLVSGGRLAQRVLRGDRGAWGIGERRVPALGVAAQLEVSFGFSKLRLAAAALGENPQRHGIRATVQSDHFVGQAFGDDEITLLERDARPYMQVAPSPIALTRKKRRGGNRVAPIVQVGLGYDPDEADVSSAHQPVQLIGELPDGVADGAVDIRFEAGHP